MIAHNRWAMPISRQQLKISIQHAKMPIAKRLIVEDMVWNGLEEFREYKTPKYVSHTGKLIKKPNPQHKARIGRPDQKAVRTILISALCRAWLEAFGKRARLNKKSDPMTAFHHFAQDVMAREGVGKIQEHLEEFWSTRVKEWEINEKGRLSGGSE